MLMGVLLSPFALPRLSRSVKQKGTCVVAPTVSFRSSSWTSPSTVPSMYRSSLPEISSLTCKLDPNRAVAPAGCITSSSDLPKGQHSRHIEPALQRFRSHPYLVDI